MARESALWQRVKAAGQLLREMGHKIVLERIENAVGVGHPDIDGCIEGAQLWLELKSTDRPKRATTKLALKLRPSQTIWHRQRAAAGFRRHWILIQVGDHGRARLYLIPGTRYEELNGATEWDLKEMSVLAPEALAYDVLMRAREGW